MKRLQSTTVKLFCSILALIVVLNGYGFNPEVTEPQESISTTTPQTEASVLG